ncbi:uncharacterized protein K460DRAFT_156921 [Cucurbitaria berberidis CBS 394.84]|uniref:Uncharacterized protein n=1 Tax=Cucurbitaria berberidis CBS 394.84 TaxID=1168544 RepID=A0A9P4GDR0_9PLEO|nr:uncharacterized protein K460DRAFT_156921 [Cucurbitaria berberidis CBS 394.84]KAF1844063.1 hypothetical protein K460DRAFT_156921 [Cucurbitaria berberidis CBS 394.84]
MTCLAYTLTNYHAYGLTVAFIVACAMTREERHSNFVPPAHCREPSIAPSRPSYLGTLSISYPIRHERYIAANLYNAHMPLLQLTYLTPSLCPTQPAYLILRPFSSSAVVLAARSSAVARIPVVVRLLVA